ncbi:MAG: hypothetical protein RQ867_01245 [Mariprofundaceae bacterium]|nr:hypothetical protein [Mariprofundaceae bacterium]
MKRIIILSLIIGILTAILAPFIADLYIYKVHSNYSGDDFIITFSNDPTEEEIIDAVIYREPLIDDKYETTKAWKKARDEKTRLFIKKDSHISILVMPYDASVDPDLVFDDGDRIKGLWLTEPNNRKKYSSFWVGVGYILGGLLSGFVAALIALSIIRLTWHFLLERLMEISNAVNSK